MKQYSCKNQSKKVKPYWFTTGLGLVPHKWSRADIFQISYHFSFFFPVKSKTGPKISSIAASELTSVLLRSYSRIFFSFLFSFSLVYVTLAVFLICLDPEVHLGAVFKEPNSSTRRLTYYQSHVNCLLGQERATAGQLHGSWNNNKLWQILWGKLTKSLRLLYNTDKPYLLS